MVIGLLDLILAGTAGSLVLGLSCTVLFGTYVGSIATLAGLIAGPALRIAWPHIRERLHPFVCADCGAHENELGRRELKSWSVPKPVHLSDLMQYDTGLGGKGRSRIEQIIIKRTTYEEFRKCLKCGLVEPIKTYTADTEITFSP